MNHLLYNISVVMLLVGLMMITWYSAKTSTTFTCPKQQIYEESNQIEKSLTMRPTQVFSKMFMEPDIWQGYESVPVIKSRI